MRKGQTKLLIYLLISIMAEESTAVLLGGEGLVISFINTITGHHITGLIVGIIAFSFLYLYDIRKKIK